MQRHLSSSLFHSFTITYYFLKSAPPAIQIVPLRGTPHFFTFHSYLLLKKKRHAFACLFFMAEWEGFEPSDGF